MLGCGRFGRLSNLGGRNSPLVGVVPYPATAMFFDGSNDYLTTNGDVQLLAADSPLITFNVWARLDVSDLTQSIVGATTTNEVFNFRWEHTDFSGGFHPTRWEFTLFNSSFDAIGRLRLLDEDDTWAHHIISVDMSDESKIRWYKNGVKQSPTVHTFIVDADIHFLRDVGWGIGAHEGGSSKMTGSLAELALWAGSYRDLDIEGEIEKYIKNGRPVDLGADGSAPFGTTANFIFNRPTLDEWHINDGDLLDIFGNPISGDQFEEVGAPTDGTTPVKVGT